MKSNLLKILFGRDVDQKGASFADTLRALLSPKATDDDAYQQLKQVRRVHRRLEAILLHPLSHKVVQEVNREQLEAARNALRAALGYSESLGRALGQQSADDEIEVRLQPDGQYAYRISPDCNVEEFERHLYSPAI